MKFAHKATSTKKSGIVTGYILEPPDIGNGVGNARNKPDVSCIKADTYQAGLYESPGFHTMVILLQNKYGREWIEIHPGNYPRNTKGCILVGELPGRNTVWKSRDKLAELIEFCGNDEIIVIVKD
ncbi:DUF5675 family protein [Halocella sp. SP3-1]|uniref:DUF5675 family protein n=1 Tax=Halocella sp. SP3-1 TaxID=2382161 RepID=UPI000F74E31A|nr:DUF5675 family protein [Halocella sp. SP3-1]AZO96077.1 hypothetical protein D7D81_16590 [Halocella sp. SP3-1]